MSLTRAEAIACQGVVAWFLSSPRTRPTHKQMTEHLAKLADAAHNNLGTGRTAADVRKALDPNRGGQALPPPP